jgi:thiamine-phosphate pyrophosphorylase
MTLCYVTDRRQLRDPVLDHIEAAAQAGVDWIQIREKDLSARDLMELTIAARRLVPRGTARLLVNERLDIALAAGADGVHLPSDSAPVVAVRACTPPGFLIGVSCHRLDETRQAAQEGADFVVFGPVFDTPSKRAYGSPRGLDELAAVCRTSPIPVLAVGGIGTNNAPACLRAGAAGLAAISLFQNCDSLTATVAKLRQTAAAV